MGKKFVRIFQELDVKEVKKQLLVYGDVSANCANCKALGLNLNVSTCPECKAEFKYIGFRNVKNHIPKLTKLKAQRPSITLIDYDDFKYNYDALKAEEFLK